MMRLFLILAILVGVVPFGQSQTTTYKVIRRMNVWEALGFEQSYGLNTSFANTSGKATVNIYLDNTDYNNGGISKAFLYGISRTGTTNGEFLGQPWDITLTNSACYWPLINIFACPLSGGPIYTEKSTAYRDRLMRASQKFIVVGGVIEEDLFLELELDVVIELELAYAELFEVQGLKLPGLPILHSSDFSSYKSPCLNNPNFAGCQALADLKDVTTYEAKKPIVIAHRGFHGDRVTPENSRLAVERAYNSGFRYVEVDIRMTKDNVPFLFHDDYLGYATDFPTLNNTDSSTFTETKLYNEIKDLKYRNRYWDRTVKTAQVTRDGSVTSAPVYLGEVLSSNNQLTSFEAICDFISGKDIFLFLDIKSTPTARNFEVMKRCMEIGRDKNVLHQLGFKMVRTNLPDGHPNKLNMPVDTAKQYLGNVYTQLSPYLNIHVVDYDPSIDTHFINDWINEGNIIGFEFDINSQQNSLFYAPAIRNLNKTEYGNLPVWKYTKSLNYRTGIWSSIALDPRGRPGHDPSKWGAGGPLNRVTNLASWQHYVDNRARFEIVSMLAPQYITHDRPDQVVRYLEAVNMLNPKTKR